MSIEVISIGSSSSGNSYLILAGKRTIILDVGLTAKKIFSALEECGREPADVDAVLVTHEHTDHVKSVRAVSRKCCEAVFYASAGTVARTQNFKYVPEERIRIMTPGDEAYIGGPGGPAAAEVMIGTFALSHDAADPIGFTVSDGEEKLAVVTDTGIVTDGIFDAVLDADLLVFEANHDENLLMYGEYPYRLKLRIKGDHGHLSNRLAGETLLRLFDRRKDLYNELTMPVIMLAHLSEKNNAPYYARRTVEDILKAGGYERDTDYSLEIALKEGITRIGNA